MLKSHPQWTHPLPDASPGETGAQAQEPAQPAAPIIADRAEFVDALRRLRQGRLLVRPRTAEAQDRATSMLDGGYVYTAYEPMLRYGLIEEFHNPDGFPTLRYFQLTSSGKRFADKANRAWRQLPWLQRLAVRLTG